MNDSERIIALLERIDANQRKALEVQQQHLGLAQAQLDRTNKTIQESIELQRVAVARQAQVTKIVIPLIGVLLGLLGYLLIRWRVF
jgi:hypothetical protein